MYLFWIHISYFFIVFRSKCHEGRWLFDGGEKDLVLQNFIWYIMFVAKGRSWLLPNMAMKAALFFP